MSPKGPSEPPQAAQRTASLQAQRPCVNTGSSVRRAGFAHSKAGRPVRERLATHTSGLPDRPPFPGTPLCSSRLDCLVRFSTGDLNCRPWLEVRLGRFRMDASGGYADSSLGVAERFLRRAARVAAAPRLSDRSRPGPDGPVGPRTQSAGHARSAGRPAKRSSIHLICVWNDASTTWSWFMPG